MKDDKIYLQHIRDAIQKIETYSMGGKESFNKNTQVQDAVIRNLEIIGEAVKNLSVNLKNKHKDIPWGKMAGMRDEMIHEYFGVDLEIVWNVLEKDLPKLKSKVDQILSN